MAKSKADPKFTDADVELFYNYLRKYAVGQARAIVARVLVKELGLRSGGDRTLRAYAHRAIELGWLVCADNAGYFIPADRAQTMENVGRLRSQAQQMSDRAKLIEVLADKLFSNPAPPAPEPNFFDTGSDNVLTA